MEPAQLLITLLLTGAVGSAALTGLFFIVMSRVIQCPACRSRVFAQHSFCSNCGSSVKVDRTTRAGDVNSVSGSVRGSLQQTTDDDDVRRLYERFCHLSPENQSRLNALIQEQIL